MPSEILTTSQEGNQIPDIAERNQRPLISIVVAAYNEASLLHDNLLVIVEYLHGLEDRYRWELIIVNDGSSDASGQIAKTFAAPHDNVIAVSHSRNYGVGRALRTGFANSSGDYVVTLDIDLSYDVDHILELIHHMQESGAKMVLASPYMAGGRVDNVPPLRRILSVLGNRFLGFFLKERFSTITCMVRAYDGRYIRSLNIKGMGLDVMPETLYKSLVLGATVDEIPARLDWGPQRYEAGRSSSTRILHHIAATVMSGFIFRPFFFFVLPGLLLGAFSVYVNYWMVAHFFEALAESRATGVNITFSGALSSAYARYPHTFVVGLLSLMLSVQLVSLGILSLQNKRYFEELFHLGSASRDRMPVREPGSGEGGERRL